MGITERFSINKNELNSSLSRIRERRRPARLRANELMATEINRLYCNKTKYKRWNTITRNRNQKSASPSRSMKGKIENASTQYSYPHSFESNTSYTITSE